MKTSLLTLAVMMACCCHSFAQLTLIPDPIFEQALIDQGADTDGVVNGSISTTDAETTINIFLANKGITDLTGVEDFVNLQYLNILNNSLNSIDITNCPNVNTIICGGNLFIDLDLSSTPQLQRLLCQGNMLTSLDLSSKPDLYEVNCSGNDLTSIDFMNNPALIEINTSTNPIDTLDLSANPLLVEVNCNTNQLDTLVLTGLSQMPILRGTFLGFHTMSFRQRMTLLTSKSY